MSPAQAADKLAKQMKLGGESRGHKMTGPERVAHENASPEERAAMSTARLQKTEEDIAAKQHADHDAARDAQAYIGSEQLASTVAACQRAVQIEEMTLRAALRQARQEGFRAGWKARHISATL